MRIDQVFLGLALFVCVAPLAAQDQAADGSPADPGVAREGSDFDGMRPADLLAEFQRDNGRWARESCTFGTPLLAAMEAASPDNVPIRRVSLLAQAYCAIDEDRFADGIRHVRALRELDPDTAYVPLTLYLGRRAGDTQLLLDLFSWLDGKSAKDLEAPGIWLAVRAIRDAGRADEFEDQALAWFDSGLISDIDADLRLGLALRALDASLRKGRSESVPLLLKEITHPASNIDLLVDRTYEPIWPIIAERAGTNLENIGDLNVKVERERLTQNKDDSKRFNSAVRALYFNGEFEAAIALVEKWLKGEGAGGKKRKDRPIDEDTAWAMNMQAYAYDALGKTEKGDAVFDRLAQIDPEENGWVVNFVINRASRLVGFGRFEEGLEAAGLARKVPGSTYAELIVARDHACALNALGRTQEAEPELEFLRENKNDGLVLAVQGLLCHGLRDEAAALLLEGLRDPVVRDGLLGDLQPPSAHLFYTQSMLPSGADLVAEYPELAEEFARYARILPEELTPRASLLRVRLDLPEWKQP